MELHCSVNACVGSERKSKITTAQRIKQVLVVGGGPGGMEAAIVASQRGHDVTIYEKQQQLGGKLIFAAIPPGKDEISFLTNYLITQIKKSRINIELNKIADLTSIKKFNPDVVILATGARPVVPKIPGADGTNVVFAEAVLAGALAGQKFVIIGGGLVGCETAEYLLSSGKTVTIVEMLEEMAAGVNESLKVGLLHRLKINGVTMLTGVKCQRIEGKRVFITNKEGLEQNIEANTVVIAVGAKSNNELYKYLKDVVPEIYLVGDCVEPRRILDAISDGHRIGLSV
jgi:pyruvate/2-oxoglutarate dehydrogenase complex dihydrolipoamide dehydrogenase (E3) component